MCSEWADVRQMNRRNVDGGDMEGGMAHRISEVVRPETNQKSDWRIPRQMPSNLAVQDHITSATQSMVCINLSGAVIVLTKSALASVQSSVVSVSMLGCNP